MRANPTCTIAIVVVLVAVFGSPRLAAAQNFPADPLALRMPDDATGADVELIVSIATRLGVPIGFEAVGALSERVSMPFSTRAGSSRSRPIVSVRPHLLDVRGLTLRQALDAAVAVDRRYEWREVDGVVVARPRPAWRDPEHPLLRRVTATQRDDAGVATDFDGSVFDLLNEAVRAHGRAQWSLRSEVSTIFLDGGRAVTVSEPVLSLGGTTGTRTVHLWPASSPQPRP